MDNAEKWLSTSEAAKRLQDAFSLSRGAAEARLLEVCQTGHVRAANIRVKFNGIGKPGIVQAEIIPHLRMREGFPTGAEVSEDDFEYWLTKNRPKVGTTGRKRQYDHEKIEARVIELMDDHGDFYPGDPAWNAQARLEVKIVDEFGIAISTLRDILPAMLERWKRAKVGK
jgi:hypothetical protein